MTVDKSKLPSPNSELQDYVESLLFDPRDESTNQKPLSNVTLLKRNETNRNNKLALKEISPSTRLSQISSLKLEKKESKYLTQVGEKNTERQKVNAQSIARHHTAPLVSAPPDPRLKNVEKLLSKISLVQLEGSSCEGKLIDATQSDKLTEQAIVENTRSTFELRNNLPLKEVLGSEFQTLVFDVNRLPLAVLLYDCKLHQDCCRLLLFRIYPRAP